MQSVLEYGIDQLSAVVDTALLNLDVNPAIHSLVIDGIFTGVGERTELSADYCNIVLLPFTDGRQRLYCPGCICYG